MTGKEIVNLIDALTAEGIPPERILNIIRYIALHDPDETAPQYPEK